MYQTTDKATSKIEPLKMEELLPEMIKEHPTMPIEEVKSRLRKAIQEEYESLMHVINNPRKM